MLVYVLHETSGEGTSLCRCAVTGKQCTKKCAARADVLVVFAVAPLAPYLVLRNTFTDFCSSPQAVYKYLISLQS